MKIPKREIAVIGVIALVVGAILLSNIIKVPEVPEEELPAMLAADSVVVYFSDGTEQEQSLSGVSSMSLYYGTAKVIGMDVRFRATPYYKADGVVDTTKNVVLSGTTSVTKGTTAITSYVSATNADGSSPATVKSGSAKILSYYGGYPGPVTESKLRGAGLGDGTHVLTWTCSVSASCEELTATGSLAVQTTITLNTVALTITVEHVDVITA